jgi:Tol biopolymer transport system component
MARTFAEPLVKFAQYVATLSLAASFVTACAFLEPFLPPQEETSPSWSPDGKQIAYECYVEGPTEDIAEWNGPHFTEEAADICTIGVDGRNRVRLTKEAGADRYPVWSPSGTQIAYTRSDGIYVINADGTNQRRLVPIVGGRYPEEVGGVAWLPDGSRLLFSACLQSLDRRDVYLADANTGALTNLTSHDGSYNGDPMWTLNGEQVVFWSGTAEDLVPGTCFPEAKSNLRLKAVNVDGTEERVIYDKEIFVSFSSVSNIGQIAFISDLVSKTSDEYLMRSGESYLYTIGLEQKEPIKRSTAWRLVAWSPDGKYLIYEDRGDLILEIETGTTRRLPSVPPQKHGSRIYNYYIEDYSWSPDGQEIAVTTLANPTGFYEERHVHIFDLQSNTFRPLIRH